MMARAVSALRIAWSSLTRRYPVDALDLGQDQCTGLDQVASRGARLPPLFIPGPRQRHQQGGGSIVRSAGAGQGVAGGGAGHLPVVVLVVVLRRPAFVLDQPAPPYVQKWPSSTGCGFMARRVTVFRPSRMTRTIGPLNKMGRSL